MSFVLRDRVQETTTTTGTGTITLAGAKTGFRSFTSAVGNGDTCLYCIEDGTNWEVGLGTFTLSGTTLSRDRIIASSNSGSAVNWGAGTKNVFLTLRPQEYILLRDEKSSGAYAGTFTNGAWRTRDLNTKVSDVYSNCTLSSNQFVLTAGTYRIAASCPALNVDGHQARLQNVTDATTIIVGTTGYAGGNATYSVYPQTHSFVNGEFTIGASKSLEIQHRCQTTATTYGFGAHCGGFASIEVYTVVELWKLG